MSDFKQQISERLSRLALDESTREEIIEEISAHLELIAAELCAGGMTKDAARRRALEQVGNWKQLVQGIKQNKENRMRDRFRRLWFPGLITGVSAYSAQMLLFRRISSGPSFVSGTWVYSLQWLLILFVTGALGAYLSRRAGGSIGERILAALAPAEAMAAAMAVGLPIGLSMEAFTHHQTPYALSHPAVLFVAIAMVVLLPAVPSIVGAAPFLLGSNNLRKASATS